MLGWLLPEAVAQIQVSGKVTEASTGIPLPGVTVLVKGTSVGSTTGAEGNFNITAPGSDAVLVFSFIGYTPQEVTVGNKSVINIALKEDVELLEEVVVVGYGTQKKSDVTGAVAQISGDKLRNTVTANIDQALQGRVAGVQVTQNSGAPGGAVSIRIRGTNSITGSNEPLYVIDGIQIQGDGARSAGFDWSGAAGGQQSNSSSPLANLSPNDIESMEVLKDASATAIYGSRAANGVVIITTKRGKKGEARISYDGYYAIQELPKKLDMMNLREYAEYNNQLAAELTGVAQNERFMDPSLLGPGTDWQDEVFQTAPMQSHQLSVQGGTDKSTYAIMGGFFKQDGIIIGSGFDRFNVRANLDSQVKEWAKIGANIAYSNTDEVITLNDSGDGVIAQALQMTPSVPVRNIDGSYGGPPLGQLSAQIGANPVALALMRNNTLERQTISANFFADLNIYKDLTFRSEYGFNQNQGLAKAFIPTYEWGSIRNDVSQLKQRNETGFFWIFKNYLTYNKTLGEHTISAMGGTEAQRSEYEGSEFFKVNFASNNITTPNQGDNSDIPTNGWAGSNTLVSYFGRTNYNYADRYLLTLTLRADGSSRFGPNNRWGYFPSVAVAWRVANESFMPKSEVLTDLKIRAGYGEVGNQAIPNYAYGSSLRNINSAFGMSYISDRISNPDLKWETTAQYNVGMDVSLFNGRIDLTVDAYKKFTRDMLLQVAIPNYMGGGAGGIGAPYANVGRLENKGFELGLHTRNIVTPKFTWSSDLNFTLNRNTITELDRSYFRGLYWYAGYDQVTRTMAGQPVGMFYGYVTDGLFTSAEEIRNHAVQVREDGTVSGENPNGINYVHERDGVWVGDVKFKDINKDGVIDSRDQTTIGDPNPDFTFGFNNSLTYGPFDLTVFLSGSYGADVFNFQRARIESMTSMYDNQAATIVNRARPAVNDQGEPYLLNPGTDIPRFAQLNVNANDRMSDRWIEDGSFIRLQNVSLAYTLPQTLTRRVKIERLRLYVNGQNLHTFTKYSGYDPEIGAFEQDALRQNIDMGRYPMPRTVTFGVNAEF
ncbi:SusC/RagA family TonB-linked outer membrane protein [Pontibacter akesuensis]|nr:SusC/RagA family TonB-linked outer membrane protein [Pontibacter akesuensis]